MIEGIEFLEDARSGIRHQHERFDGGGTPDGLAGQEIPVAARIVAVAAAVEALMPGPVDVTLPARVVDAARLLRSDPGRFDPAVGAATIEALEKHGWPSGVGTGVPT